MMFWHGWRREVESQSAASGLTGAPELVEPPPEPPKNWRQRWAEVRRAAAGTTAALSALVSTVRNIAQQLLQELVQMRIQLLVMEHAARLDLPFFEDPASYDLLRRAQNDSANRPVMMISTAFGLVQTAITFVSMVALLLAISPLLALLALLSPIPAFISDTRYGWRGFNIARWSSRLLRRMNYLVSLVTTDTYAKEVKLFDLAILFVLHFRTTLPLYC